MLGKSLISESTARQIIDLLLRQSGESQDLAAHLYTQTSGEEFRECGPLIAAVTYALYEEGLKPLFKLYPHLKPDGLL